MGALPHLWLPIRSHRPPYPPPTHPPPIESIRDTVLQELKKAIKKPAVFK